MNIPYLSLLKIYATVASLFPRDDHHRSNDDNDEDRRAYKMALYIYSMNEKAMTYFKTTLAERDGNFAFSPFCITQLLSMSTFGAPGNTKEQLIFNATEYRMDQEEIINNLQESQTVMLNLANKIFISDDFEINSTYVWRSELFGQSIATKVNFKDIETAENIINAWAQNSTENHLKFFIKKKSDLSRDKLKLGNSTKLFLASISYFKGNFESPFDKNLTKLMPFSETKDSEIEVPTMFQKNIFNCDSLDHIDDLPIKAKFIELPYETRELNESISMFIIVPNKIEDLKQLEQNIDKIPLSVLQNGFPRQVELWLPKFKIQSAFDFEYLLNQTGIKDAFHFTGNFTETSKESGLSISNLVQRSVIKVVDQGVGKKGPTSIKKPDIKKKNTKNKSKEEEDDFETYTLKVNRPFLVIIANRDFILFTARVTDPSNSGDQIQLFN